MLAFGAARRRRPVAKRSQPVEEEEAHHQRQPGKGEVLFDEFQRLAPILNSVDRDALIQRSKLATLMDGQPEQIDICDLSVGDDQVGLEHVTQTHVL